jgi:hypothetical protein
MFQRMRFAAIACMTIMSSAASGEMRLPYILGAGVHHGTFLEKPIYEVPSTISALRDLGFTSIRDDFGWSSLANQPTNVFPPRMHRLKAVLDATAGRVQPILALTMGAPDYNGGRLPVTDEAQARYAAFAAQAVRVTASYKPVYEIWNEWNLGTGTRQHVAGSADDYVRLAKAAYRAMKAAAPDATILVGGMGTDLDAVPLRKREWTWTSRAIELGLLDNGDGLSVHFYNVCRPRDERRPSEAVARLGKLVQILEAARPGQGYPIFITEAGWPGKVATGCGFSEEEQISFSAQFLLWVTKFPTLKGVWIYELKDSGVEPDNLEHHFGLLDFRYTRKPYLCGVLEARSVLDGATFVRETAGPGGSVQILFAKPAGAAEAVWAPDPGPDQTYVVPAGQQAKFICDDAIHPAGSTVSLRERPLIVTPAS